MNAFTSSRRLAAKGAFAACLAATFWITGCASRAPVPPSEGVPLPEAVNAALEQLIFQVRPNAGWAGGLRGRSLVVEPLQDSATGQQTSATVQAGKLVADRVRAAYPEIEVLPFLEPSLAKASWILSGRLIPAKTVAQNDRSRQTLQLVLTDIGSGALVAQSSAPVRDSSLDHTPTTFFLDSPVLASPPPEAAPERVVERARASTLIESAMSAYDQNRLSDALALFDSAQKAPGVDMMRVEIGRYLVYSRIGQKTAARDAFGRIAALGIARRSLAVKFLFEPGKVDFWSDPAVSEPYAMWLEQIATEAGGSSACMRIVGHSSHTGTPEFNDQLSKGRAERVGELLQRTVPQLSGRFATSGRGFRENLVGSGTDDLRDALDRRVEFKFSDC